MPPVLSVPLSARAAVRAAVTIAVVAAPAGAAPATDLGIIGTEPVRGTAAKRKLEGGECAGQPCPDGYVVSPTRCDTDLTQDQCQKAHTHTGIEFDIYFDDGYIPGCHCSPQDAQWWCYFTVGAPGPKMAQDYMMCKAPATSVPWDLQQVGDVDVEFGAGGDKSAKFKYLKGKGRDYVHSLTAGTCGDNVTVGEDVVTTTPNVTAVNDTHEELEVAHVFNLSLVSSIPELYNNVSSILRFCQSVGLIHNLSATDYYLIAQIETQVDITLNMTSGFDVDVVTEKATVEQSDKNVTLTDVLDAYHCTGTDLVEVPAGAKLKPNDELSVCVVSKDTNFEIETLDNMYVSSGFKAPYDELKIVNNAAAVIDAITSLVQPTATSAVVTTRLPVNVIDYDAEGTVTIEGTATMKFQGGRRRLAVGGRALQAAAAGEEDAAFGVSISLAPVEEEAAGPLSGATALAAGSAAFAAGMAALLLAW